ncbi:MAG: hypothetical protein E7646_02590 [Ruminococcaceae bacterium]|nr:hypothetical protein [Oscillospiraceae bacterium]
MNNFFTDAFNNMDDQARESFYKTVFLNDDSQYAQELRQRYYKSVLKHMGEKVKIGKGVKIVNPQFISLGDRVTVCDNSTLIARGEGGITIGNNVTINDRVYLDTERKDSGYITVGDHCYIGTGTTLFGHLGLEIGDHVLMAQNITVTPYSHIFSDPEKNIISQGGHQRKVTIGRDSYLGMGVIVMYSADIGEGSVIGAGTLVTKPIPPYSVAVGHPARVIKKRQ